MRGDACGTVGTAGMKAPPASEWRQRVSCTQVLAWAGAQKKLGTEASGKFTTTLSSNPLQAPSAKVQTDTFCSSEATAASTSTGHPQHPTPTAQQPWCCCPRAAVLWSLPPIDPPA